MAKCLVVYEWVDKKGNRCLANCFFELKGGLTKLAVKNMYETLKKEDAKVTGKGTEVVIRNIIPLEEGRRMTKERAIAMIDEYLLEPNNIDKAWVEVLELCKKALSAEEQQAEMERLDKEVERLSQCVLYHDGQIVDAIKEFAERLKERAANYFCAEVVFVENIDRLVKEMVEAENE